MTQPHCDIAIYEHISCIVQCNDGHQCHYNKTGTIIQSTFSFQRVIFTSFYLLQCFLQLLRIVVEHIEIGTLYICHLRANSH